MIRDRGQGFRATFEGAKHALRMIGVTHTDDDAKGQVIVPLEPSELRIAHEFARENADKDWCVSRWRQEIAGHIGRSCHTIPFADVRGVLAAERIKPAKLSGGEYGRSARK